MLHLVVLPASTVISEHFLYNSELLLTLATLWLIALGMCHSESMDLSKLVPKVTSLDGQPLVLKTDEVSLFSNL